MGVALAEARTVAKLRTVDLARHDDNSPLSHLARQGIDDENLAAKVAKLAEDGGLWVE